MFTCGFKTNANSVAAVIALILFVAIGCGDDNSSGSPPKSCTKLEPGTAYCTIGNREYVVYVPQSYSEESQTPLIIDMHGAGGVAREMVQYSPWTRLADTQGFIVAFPQGRLGLWNARSFGCGVMQRPKLPDDVAFIESVVANIRDAANIDSDRIIATGTSNGGAMAHTLACESADIFTAAVTREYPLSGDGGIEGIIAGCAPAQPIPIIQFHGLHDESVPYHGVGDCPDVQESNWAWSVIQNCASDLVESQVNDTMSCETYQDCDGGVSVTLCTDTEWRHGDSYRAEDPDIATYSWELLTSFFTGT